MKQDVGTQPDRRRHRVGHGGRDKSRARDVTKSMGRGAETGQDMEQIFEVHYAQSHLIKPRRAEACIFIGQHTHLNG